jgi:probable phosphoglycerate mutase
MLAPGVTLYFVRHGETDWNRDRRYQGQRDIPLNDTGRAQAARNGRTLRDELGGRVREMDYIASPLLRARETMQIMRRELGLPTLAYRTDDRLKEVHYGYWEGQLADELAVSDPNGFAARDRDPWDWQPRGGESYSMLAQRVAACLAELRRDAVVSSHGGVSRVLRGLVLDIPDPEVPFLPVPQDKVLVVVAGSISWL